MRNGGPLIAEHEFTSQDMQEITNPEKVEEKLTRRHLKRHHLRQSLVDTLIRKTNPTYLYCHCRVADMDHYVWAFAFKLDLVMK